METRSHSSSFKSIARTALAGLGIFILSGNLDCALAQLTSCLCATAGGALGLVPCFVMTACQAMHAYVFDYHGLLQHVLPMLLSSWPLLRFLGGAL